MPMHLTRSGTTEMPTTFAEWQALEPIQKSNLFDAWGELMLVNISDSHLFRALPPSGRQQEDPHYHRISASSSTLFLVVL